MGESKEKSQKSPISSTFFKFVNFRTVLCWCHSNSGLEEIIESGNGIETEFGCQCFQRYVVRWVGQGSDSFVDAEMVHIMRETGLRMLVDDARQVGAVGT